jgi:UDP-glucose 4-epimerase
VQRLLRDGHTVVALDNLFRGHVEAIEAVEARGGGRLHFVKADVGDRSVIEPLLRQHKIEAVMHFAALAYVGESVDDPLRYYRNNSAAALSLLEACDVCGVTTARVQLDVLDVWGAGGEVHSDSRDCPQSPINPYGRSKLHVEHMLFDYTEQRRRAGKPFAFAALRYFNVAGSDRTGLIGEHHEPETHLIPVILQAILGKRESITIFGTDYPTPDGTCIRDYIHVEDLIDAHVQTLGALKAGDSRTYNLGIGRGTRCGRLSTRRGG